MINYTPSGTRCYCGSAESLEFCASCRVWLTEHSPRLAGNWAWWFAHCLANGLELPSQWGTEAAESNDLLYFLRGRNS